MLAERGHGASGRLDRASRHRAHRRIAIYGLATVAFGLSTSFWLTFWCLAATGAADTVSAVFRNLIRQLETPDGLRGRMTGVNMVFFIGGPQLGELEAGLLAQWAGPVVSVVSGGIGCLDRNGVGRLGDAGAAHRTDAPRSHSCRWKTIAAKRRAVSYNPHTLGKLKVAVLYDRWEEPEEASASADKAPLTRTLDKKEVEDEVAEALGKLGHEPTL